MTTVRSGVRRGLALAALAAARRRGRRLRVAAVVDSVDSGAVVRLAHVDVRRRQEARHRCRTSRSPRTRRSRGRSRSASRRPASRRPSRRTRSTRRRRAARSCASIPRAARWSGASRPARKLAAGVGADATLVVVGTDKGDVLAFDTERQGAMAGKGVERSAGSAAGRRRHRRRVDGRRPHPRAHRGRRQDEMGLSAHEPAAHDPQLRRRHRRAAAACSPARPAASCSRSISTRATSAGRATWRRRRARPSSSASPT